MELLLAAAPILAVGAIIVSTGVEILPPEGIVSTLTLPRVLLILGIAALVVDGARLGDFRTGLDPAIGLLLLAAAATTFFGGYTAAPVRFLLTALGLFYLTVGLYRRRPREVAPLILLALLAMAGPALAGVAQVAQDTPTTFYRDGFTPVFSGRAREDLLVRAIGTFSNPNLLAAHMLLLVPVGALMAVRAPSREARIVLWAVVALGYLALLLTFSRAGVVAAILAAGVAAYALRPAARPRLRGAAAVAGLVLLLGAIVTGGALVGGFGRTEAMALGVQVWADSPLLGVGLSRAGDVMDAAGSSPTPYAHAHNLWLTWLVEAGPLALAAFVWIAGWLLTRGLSLAARGSGPGRATSTAALVALVGFFALSVFDHPANSERIALAFWFVAALVAAAAPASPAWELQPIPRPPRRTRRAPRRPVPR